MFTRKLFYYLKPMIPRSLQLALRRMLIRRKLPQLQKVWPIDNQTSKSPEGWSGWPESKQFAFVLTHDVDTEMGQNRSLELLALDRDHGFRSSFNFVPERYPLRPDVLGVVKQSGYELGVHGLNHDGKLYSSKDLFEERARRINRYLKDWGAVGFRSPAMHHRLEWLHALTIEYDASTFDTDPFEPQPDGVGSIFPLWVPGPDSRNGFVELPYTLPQDFTLFVLMGEKNIETWKKKLDWVAQRGGMALVNTHPDYMNFGSGKCGLEEYPASYYRDFLRYVRQRYQGSFWHALPKETARLWRSRRIRSD
jgi:peptidoglycan/xylan/chitin deacetylase (PgdA/CDA1 family)